jgi:hypothetical protein
VTPVFSRRTAWSVAPNRIAAALEDRRRSGRPVLDLTETNPTQVGLRMPEAEIRAAVADRDIDGMRRRAHKFQRLNNALLLLETHAKKRRIPL